MFHCVAEDAPYYTIALYFESILGCATTITLASGLTDTERKIRSYKSGKVVGLVDRDRPGKSVAKDFTLTDNLDIEYGFSVFCHDSLQKKFIISIKPEFEPWIERLYLDYYPTIPKGNRPLKKWLKDGAAKASELPNVKRLLNDLYQKRSPALLKLQEVACSL